ncbi:MAG: hypothetical protein RIC55_30570 [Pirellulaceae bacterium]
MKFVARANRAALPMTTNPYTSPDTNSAKASPVVRRISWPAVVLQLALLAAVMTIGSYTAPQSGGMMWAGMGFLAYTLGLRMLVPRDHRRGIRQVRQGRYDLACGSFLDSYAFFSRHVWLDRYRAITLLTPSYMAYREMALCNAAYCCTQIGEGKRARELYHQALAEFPHCGMAASALNMIESIESSQDRESVSES